MQAQDALSVPRRALDVEDYIDIVRRHKSWIIGPAFAAIVASVVGAFLWPNTYISSATIKVQAQQVPEAYVQSNTNQQMSEKLNGMTQSVLSRSALTTIIQTFELYPRDRARLPMEDVIEKMRRDIIISQVMSLGGSTSRAVPALQISFAYTDRFKAQKVVAEITTKFIDESIRSQSTNNKGTYDLLNDAHEKAKADMEALDNQLAAFKSAHAGSLPEQQPANFTQMNALSTRVMNLNSSISRVMQEKLSLETQLRIYREQLNGLKEPAAIEQTLQKSEKVVQGEREVAELERGLSILREHYRDTYPQIQTTIGMLNTAKAKLAQAQKEDAARKPDVLRPNSSIARESRDLDAAIKKTQSMIEAKNLESEEYKKEIENSNRQMSMLQGRLEGVPASDKVYSELTRDRDIAKAKFLDLDAKMAKVDISQNMNARKFGESLELLDPASLPQTPAKPQREVIIGIGAVVGLMLGFMMAGAREMKDTSLKNLKDVRAYTQLPILGSIPLLENDLVVKRRKRLAWLGWSLAGLAGIVMMTGSVIYYFVTKV